MENIIELILSNEIYMLITICVLLAIFFFILKKMVKLIFYALGILIAFLAYVYYAGGSVENVLEPAQQVIEKAEQKVEEQSKDAQEIKKKVEKELKK